MKECFTDLFSSNGWLVDIVIRILKCSCKAIYRTHRITAYWKLYEMLHMCCSASSPSVIFRARLCTLGLTVTHRAIKAHVRSITHSFSVYTRSVLTKESVRQRYYFDTWCDAFLYTHWPTMCFPWGQVWYYLMFGLMDFSAESSCKLQMGLMLP